MAKVSFTKLGLKRNEEVKIVKYNDFDIEVKQYLPINDKVDLITRVVMNCHNSDVNYVNPMLLEVISTLEIIMAYSNITFTEKQKEDTSKLYDLLINNGLVDLIIEAIPEDEYNGLIDFIDETIDSIYTYRHSVLGILDTVSQDYSNLDLDATKIQEKLNDPNQLQMIRDVLTKLG